MINRAFIENFITRGNRKEVQRAERLQTQDMPWNENKLQLIVGVKQNKYYETPLNAPQYALVPESGMFQNFLVTGNTGTGKTASVMYPFLKQIMFYSANDVTRKAGMLVLDIMGNFYPQVLKYAEECGRSDDVVLIEPDGKNTYNPLHKPDMEPSDLAERTRSVLELFSGSGGKEASWDDKAKQMMTECIRLLRLINGYVTLSDIHMVVTDTEYLENAMSRLYEISDEIPAFEFTSCRKYFLGEFNSNEDTIKAVKACVMNMTSSFASGDIIHRSFCPTLDDLNFSGFEEAVNVGKIVVFVIDRSKHANAAKAIAVYLKLDFQTEIIRRTIPGSDLNRTRPMLLMGGEYHDFVTSNDGEFFRLSRESRCCSIVSSQSYSSILKTLDNEKAFCTLHQNLTNKIWLRSDDEATIRLARFLTGKKKKERVFDEQMFNQTLKEFTAVCFLAGRGGMDEPYIVHLLPYFREPISDKVTSTGKNPVFSFSKGDSL